tara:strand:- start:469 stop:681 length:213 start_codon:yes stop_codon:yes gene_type:complete
MKPGSVLKEKQNSSSMRLRFGRPGEVANPKMFILVNCHPDHGTFLVYDLADGIIKRALRAYMEEYYEVIS